MEIEEIWLLNDVLYSRSCDRNRIFVFLRESMLVCQLIHWVVELHLKLVKFEERIHEKEAEKNELREEKLVLKENKERIKQKLKSITVPSTGLIPAYPPAYQAGANKMSAFPSYSFIPVWQYLPSSTCDKSQDHACIEASWCLINTAL
ncbi:uncharacterized protein LOC142551255 [Primulina tabacum]|uniref:uncharacterized protein LOC142551255 n=1 Tax=Primulina tabacum TaxID=48773 RepID=UPI003F5A9189